MEVELKSSEYPMPQPDIRHPEIEKADNGYVVEWREKEKKPKGSMEKCDYIKRQMLFSMEEKEKAWEKYKELKMYCVDNKTESYW